MSAQRHALIVAGGAGKRIGGNVPKQFIPLAGIPVVIRTINTFYRTDPAIRITVVVAKEWMEHFVALVEEWELPRGIVTVSAGTTRFESVRNGLRAMAGATGFVAVHDAVRPLLTEQLVARVFDAALEKGNAVPVMPITESLRHVDESTSMAFPREALRTVQTPQCFKLEELLAAYDRPFKESFTDCATVMEEAGHRLHLVEGEEMNIKLTTKADVEFAQWYLGSGQE